MLIARGLLIVTLSFCWNAPAMAQPVSEPVGIDVCDAYLTAYEQCIRTGVPEEARAGAQLSLDQSRASWREALARTDKARRTVTAQCQQARDIILPRLQSSYGCRF